MPSIRQRSVPTIDDVAKAAGVSTSTVSRAFSHPHVLMESTVTRVLDCAARLGYSPNPVARSLSTGRRGNIAIIVPDIANPFFPPLLRAAQAVADSAGYSVFLGDSDEDGIREQRLVGKLALQVEGFVLAASRMSGRKIVDLARKVPIVLINNDTASVPRVLIDTAPGICTAVTHLAELGHRRIVYIGGPAASWSDQQRRSAVKQASERSGIRTHFLSVPRPSFDAGREIAEPILPMNVTAAITFDDFVAHGLLAGFAERGIKVPRDFSVIGCDDVLSASTYPALTSISARCDEAGRIAAELLISILQSGKASNVRRLLDTRLVTRDTTARAPKPTTSRRTKKSPSSLSRSK